MTFAATIRWTFRVLIHLTVIGLMAWLAGAGQGAFLDPDPQNTAGYQMLADALRSGQTSLLIKPSAQLLALPDPYDPQTHQPYIVTDTSLFEEKYFLYFGPLPALIRAGFTAIFRVAPTSALVGLAYGVLSYLALVCGVHLLRRRFARTTAHVFDDLLAALAGVCGVLLSLVARPSIYSEAILTGTLLVLLAFICLLVSRSTKMRVLVGFLLALAVAARLSLLPYAAAFGVWLIIDAVRTRSWRGLVVGAAPLVTVGLALAWYNFVRFHSVFENGAQFQLTGLRGAVQRIDPRCIADNLPAYLLYRPGLSSWFPFHLSECLIRNDVEPNWVREGSFAGIVWIAPVALLSPLAMWKHRGEPAVAIFAAGAAMVSVLLLCLGWAASRYLQDILPPAILLGTLQVMHWLGCASAGLRRSLMGLVIAIGLFAAVHSIAMSINEINIWRVERGAKLALRFDRLMCRLRPDWLAAYASADVEFRPLEDAYWTPRESRGPAIFLPNDKRLRLQMTESGASGSLELELLADSNLTVHIAIDTDPPIEFELVPGWNSIEAPAMQRIGPGQTFTMQVTPLGEVPDHSERLLPIRIRGW